MIIILLGRHVFSAWTSAWLKTVTSSSRQTLLRFAYILIQHDNNNSIYDKTTSSFFPFEMFFPFFLYYLFRVWFIPRIAVPCSSFSSSFQNGTAHQQDHHHKSIQWAPQEPTKLKKLKKKGQYSLLVYDINVFSMHACTQYVYRKWHNMPRGSTHTHTT